MLVFSILFLISFSFIVIGFRLLRTIYEDSGSLSDLPFSSLTKSEWKDLGICLTGIILAIIGAVLYYQVCAAAIDNLNLPRAFAEKYYLYGIGMVLASLVFVGGLATSGSLLENEGPKTTKVFLIGTVLILLVFLMLKGLAILP